MVGDRLYRAYLHHRESGIEALAIGRSCARTERESREEAAMAAQVENRDAKIQGPPVAMPTGRFATLSEALAEFTATRGRTIEFVRDCPSLAALLVNHPVFGQLTGREYALLIAGHCRRHAAQIAEIRATSANPADSARQSLADGQLERIAEGDEPPLAAQRAHFAHMIHVDDRVAMDAAELRSRQPLFDWVQRLRRQQALFGGTIQTSSRSAWNANTSSTSRT